MPDEVTLTHLDGAGRARMVDVTRKPWTHRRAVARCRVVVGSSKAAELAAGVTRAWRSEERPAGTVLDTARLAGIQAAKLTPQLIPLCHSLALSDVDLHLSLTATGVDIEAVAEVVGPTGVEMEALTACGAAALTIVQAIGPADAEVSIQDLGLWEKSGGRSGYWSREDRAGRNRPRLLLFAGARQIAGTGEIEVAPGTVTSVLEAACARFGPGFVPVVEASKVWVNGAPATGETSVGPGDEIAVIPPVSGG